MPSPADSQLEANWVNLLDEPKAILGAYCGLAPPLTSFAAHSVRLDLDEVSVAGRFLVLPAPFPPAWQDGREPHRADVVFKFAQARSIQISGVLLDAPDDDSNHGRPVGVPGSCSLDALDEVWITRNAPELPIYWKRFTIGTRHFSLELESGNARIICGRRAWASNGWN